MYYKKQFLHICCTLFLLSCLSVVSMANNTNMPIQDTVCIDSMKTAYHNEINFIIDKIENDYVSGKRGMSDRQWNDKIKNIHKQSDFYCWNYIAYIYSLSNIGGITNDAHLQFPDGGSFNRYKYFSKKYLPLQKFLK